MNVEGFVTAGGLSSRMGSDKAMLEIGGRRMIEYIISALLPVTTRVSIIANNPDYALLGFPVFADSNPGIGPLEAIRTSLANALTQRVIVVGCDLPFVASDLFSYLINLKGDYQAVVPVGRDERLEPLCAIYSVDALACVVDLIARGERKVSKLFDIVQTRFVRFDEIKHIRGSELFFENVNTPEDYARARKVINEPGMV